MNNDQPEITSNNEAAENKRDKKRKKKVSSLKAASVYRSPVSHANNSTLSSNDYGQTGTNVSYHEDGGVA